MEDYLLTNKINEELELERKMRGMGIPRAFPPEEPFRVDQDLYFNNLPNAEQPTGLGINREPIAPPQRPPQEVTWQPKNLWSGTENKYVPMPETPITISGVGNRMMIEDTRIPNMPAVDEYGNPVSPEIIKKIQSNLGEAPISEEDRAIFGMKPPNEGELNISDKLTEYGNFLDQQGIKDPKERAKYMITARNELLKQDAIQRKANVEGAGSFKDMTPEDQEKHFQNKILTNKDPKFSNRDTAGSKAYIDGYAKYLNEKGYTATEVANIQSQYKSLDKSLQNMTKQEAPMQAFVDNIGLQVDNLNSLMADADRSGVRAYDWTKRQMETKTKGSGKEAAIASYLLEISNEIGKLSSGSSASIQQLGEGARTDWNKVHDPNLSAGELAIVLNATKDQADMRMSTWTKSRENIQSQIDGLLNRGKKSVTEQQQVVLPANASKSLKEGKVTTFGNGQQWTLRNGKPIQVK